MENGNYDAVALVKWYCEKAGASDLKEEKLVEEINVLRERTRKLENENEKHEGFLVDRRGLRAGLTLLASLIKDAGDLIGRKSTIRGRDAQEILNKCLDKFENKIDSATT